MKSKMLSLGIVLVFHAGIQSYAMERWAALAQIESGNNNVGLRATTAVSLNGLKKVRGTAVVKKE